MCGADMDPTTPYSTRQPHILSLHPLAKPWDLENHCHKEVGATGKGAAKPAALTMKQTSGAGSDSRTQWVGGTMAHSKLRALQKEQAQDLKDDSSELALPP